MEPEVEEEEEGGTDLFVSTTTFDSQIFEVFTSTDDESVSQVNTREPA